MVLGDRHTPTTGSLPVGSDDQVTLELSVVIPCLNEASTIQHVLETAQRVITEHHISAEIVVADNGSTDGSQATAASVGARVVPVTRRGYGSALMAGIEAARGKYVIMGDADASYDFSEIPRFLDKLREGYDLVQGCRFESGGGKILPGAMPALHRWWGNPMFSRLAKWWFQSPVNDVYCGLRGFTREHAARLDQRSLGMEFAVEMIIKSSLHGARIAEVPITLHPDMRQGRLPHLRTFRDGWRTLRFFLMFSPRWLFIIPGLLLILAGVVGYALAMPSVSIGRMTFDAHTLLFASLALISGSQSLMFGTMAKTFAMSEGLLPRDDSAERFNHWFTLEHGLVIGGLAMLVGTLLLSRAVLQWWAVEFGALDYSETMRWVVPGVTLNTLGFQTVLWSFGLSILLMRRPS